MQLEKKYILSTIPFIFFFLGYGLCSIIIGNKTYITPNLVGLSLYEAVKQTSAHHVNIRISSEKESFDIPAGTIINQKPCAGRAIKAHQSIFITTTKAPAAIIAPALQQQTSIQVEKTCHDLGLKVKTYPIESSAPSNSCIAQFPQSGQHITDKKITIYTAQERPSIYLMPDLTNQSLQLMFNTLNNQLGKVSVYKGKQKLKPPYQEHLKIISQKPLAGSLVSLDSAIHLQLEVV